MLAASVTPQDYLRLSETLSEGLLEVSAAVSPEASSEVAEIAPGVSPETSSEVLSCQYAKGTSSKRFTFVHSGLGIHPWWIPEDKENVNQLLNDFDGAFSGTKLLGSRARLFSLSSSHC